MSNIKVKIQEDEYSITVSIPNNIPQSMKVAALAAVAAKEAADEIVVRAKQNPNYIANKFKELQSEPPVEKLIEEKTDSSPKESSTTTPHKKDDDIFKIRDRVPNNVVDISTLKIGKAETASALVRCPHCGQAHVIMPMDEFNYYLMIRDYEKNEFVPVGDPIHVPSITQEELENMFYKLEVNGHSVTKDDYFNDLQDILKAELAKVNLKDIDIVINNDSSILCPVCRQISTFNSWKNAFAHPEEFFEFNEVCDACGGELIGKNTKESTKSKRPEFILCCESCGHKQQKTKR
jgi:uncharacterized CHY-type Zn-finger protein